MVAVAGGLAHSLALKSDGSVLAWGCSSFDDGQCSVPAGAASGVVAIRGRRLPQPRDRRNKRSDGGRASTFSAIRTRLGIRLSWRTTNEASIAGFNLYRSSHGTLTRLNRQLIPAKHAGSTSRSTYTWLDPSGGQGGKRTYELQTLAAGGTRTLAGTTTLG